MESKYVIEGVSAETILFNTLTAITVHNTPLLLTRLDDDTLVAFNARCPHAAADLGAGDLHRGRIICPDHGWKFDIRSGRSLWPPDEVCRLRHYPLTLENGVLSVVLPL